MKNYININDFKFDYPLTRGTFYAIIFCLLFTILWFLLTITIFYRDLQQSIMGGFALTGIFFNILYYGGYFESGREFDLYHKQFRKYFSRGKFRIGKWKPLDTPDYFLIKKNTGLMNWWRTHTGWRKQGPRFLFDPDVFFYYQLILITKGESDYVIYVTIEHDENLRYAIPLADYLQIPIYERTVDGDNIIYKAATNSSRTI